MNSDVENSEAFALNAGTAPPNDVRLSGSSAVYEDISIQYTDYLRVSKISSTSVRAFWVYLFDPVVVIESFLEP